MKLLFSATFFLFLTSHLLVGTNDVPHVQVSGTAIIEVVPDEMHWSLRLMTKKRTVADTAEEHDRRVSRLLGFLKENEIAEENTQTSRISISENWVYRSNNRVKEGYQASTTVTFESDDLDDYRDLWIGLSNLDNVEVSSVTFDVADRIRHQNESRLKAVMAAKEKAVALAEALGAEVHEPIAIVEDLGSGFQVEGMIGNFASRSQMAADSGPSVSPGTISITTGVNVKFRISSN